MEQPSAAAICGISSANTGLFSLMIREKVLRLMPALSATASGFLSLHPMSFRILLLIS
jgi:hypothetical protein